MGRRLAELCSPGELIARGTSSAIITAILRAIATAIMLTIVTASLPNPAAAQPPAKPRDASPPVELVESYGLQTLGKLLYATPAETPEGDILVPVYDGGPNERGQILRIDRNDSVQSLCVFATSGSVGRPNPPLVLGPGGAYYGTCDYGGRHNNGTFFRLSDDGQVRILHHFNNAQGHGWKPLAGVTFSRDGWFYGVCAEGGAGGKGTIFRVNKDGKFELLHTFAWDGSEGGAVLRCHDRDQAAHLPRSRIH